MAFTKENIITAICELDDKFEEAARSLLSSESVGRFMRPQMADGVKIYDLRDLLIARLMSCALDVGLTQKDLAQIDRRLKHPIPGVPKVIAERSAFAVLYAAAKTGTPAYLHAQIGTSDNRRICGIGFQVVGYSDDPRDEWIHEGSNVAGNITIPVHRVLGHTLRYARDVMGENV